MKPDTKFITGLKALGAIMVITSHLKMQFSDYTDLTWKLITFPAYFIILFVCISAYTLTLSIDKKESFSLWSYMKRRWLRLAPLYYSVLLLGLIIKILINGWPGFGTVIQSVFYHLTFLNIDPISTATQASILNVEWMLPIMFWSYLLIPLSVLLIKKIPVLFILLLGLSVVLHFQPTLITTYKGFGGFGWSLQFYIIMYIYTILMYFLYHRPHIFINISQKISSLLMVFAMALVFILALSYIPSKSERIYAIILEIITIYLLWIKPIVLKYAERYLGVASGFVNNADSLILGAILVKYMINLYYITVPHFIVLLWFTALLLACTYRPWITRILFENRLAMLLGTVSFGMYLLHPLAIIAAERLIPMQYPLVRTALIFPLSIGSAYLAYKYIENPRRGELRNTKK